MDRLYLLCLLSQAKDGLGAMSAPPVSVRELSLYWGSTSCSYPFSAPSYRVLPDSSHWDRHYGQMELNFSLRPIFRERLSAVL